MIDASRFPLGVVVCTYRRSHRLDAAVRQVFAQSGADDQFVVIVNDGSQDDGSTAQAMTCLEREFAGRVRLVNHPLNRGVGAARTTGGCGGGASRRNSDLFP